MLEDKVYLSESLKDRLDLSEKALVPGTIVQLSVDGNLISSTKLLSMKFTFFPRRDQTSDRKLCALEFSTDVNNIRQVLQCNDGFDLILQQDDNVIMHESISLQSYEIDIDIGKIINDRATVYVHLNI